ncbi:MAG TPA: quinolinate synthase NadA [Chloroflexia bacterium]|nr:quinolinate synthase NadA [Chloroflexia bacterium]
MSRVIHLSIDREIASGAACSPELKLPTWSLDVEEGRAATTKPTYGPGASQWDEAPATTPLQHEIPARYRLMDAAELERRIEAARAALGEKLVILGHHYQREDIIRHADLRGDSYKLSELAARRPEAEYIVFCGVHFMAESADILSGPHQHVILPNMAAGCSMADMANLDDVLDCWDTLEKIIGTEPDAEGRQPVVPVTYINSAASLKAVCGEHGGIVCTSSNAENVLKWAFERGQRVLFFPDQHLGRNTAVKLGIPLEQTVLWNPMKPLGGNTPEQLRQAKVILWRGWCSVHKRFTVEQINKARAEYPGVKVVVHPECPLEVVQAADEAGSTEYIIKAVEKAPTGSVLAIGTEINLVRRLQAEHPDKTIFCLDPVICPCSTMYRIHPAYLAWVLEGLLDGQVLNQVKVDEQTKQWARVALDRMLTVK